MRLRLLPLLLCAGLLGHAAVPSADPGSGIHADAFDTRVKPWEDFYRYVNGPWILQNSIPADQTSWGSFDEVYENNRKILKEILEQAAAAKAPKGSALQKVGDFFASGMDEAAIEKAGLAPIQPMLDRIEGLKNPSGLAAEIGRMHLEGSDPAFGAYVDLDGKDSTRYIFKLTQGGLGLPDRDYYTREDSKSQELREQYVKHLAAMFKLLGDDERVAQAHADAVMGIETRLAKASMTRVEGRDPNATYHKMSPAELTKLAPDFPWDMYFQAIGLRPQKDLLVRQPKFFEELGRMAKDVPIQAWKTYLRWHLINANDGALPDAFGREHFEFYGKVLSGSKERRARWKRVQAATDGAMGELVGQLYVERAFSPEAKAKMLEIVNNLRAALHERIENLPWMTQATKKLALQKLDAFGVKIGYPDKWRDYSSLEVSRNGYLANQVAAARFDLQRQLAKLGQPIDRSEWGMDPQIVNAGNNFAMNELTFPAGILQPPFFDPRADDATNYGAIGMVIGHEMTHGFDDAGRKYDSKGNLLDWWTAEDVKAYEARTKLVEDQFSAYEVLPGVKVNGKLTLGENISDLGGLRIAFEALKKQWARTGKPAPSAGLTPEQRFFVGYARVWRSDMRDEEARNLVLTDPHSPDRFRVNGPLSNMPEFHEAFGCPDGSPMKRPAPERPSIW